MLLDGVRKALVSIYFWVWISIGSLLATALIVPLYLIMVLKNRFDYGLLRYIIEVCIATIPTYMMEIIGIWEVNYIHDYDNNDNQTNYIIVANHNSIVDTIFTAMLPFEKVYTWKKKWAYVPVFGWLCWLADHITIDPSDPISKREALDKSIQTVRSDNISIVFYPEGTRNNTSRKLLDFKTGAFRVAETTGRPILPVTITGSKTACNGFIADMATVNIYVGKPIRVTDIDDAVHVVRNEMLKHLQ